jgi:hypothetical protein
MENLIDRIVKTALSYEGKEEIVQNKGFKDPKFQVKMEAVGWDMLEPWCVLFTELVWRESYGNLNSLIADECRKLFSDSCTLSFKNFKKAGWDVDMHPSEGSIAIWQLFKNGKGQWQGHAGIVVDVFEVEFLSIEGNSNDNGSRNGFKVAKKVREYNFTMGNGLRLIGFIKPKPI